jgi:hypothetical protein
MSSERSVSKPLFSAPTLTFHDSATVKAAIQKAEIAMKPEPPSDESEQFSGAPILTQAPAQQGSAVASQDTAEEPHVSVDPMPALAQAPEERAAEHPMDAQERLLESVKKQAEAQEREEAKAPAQAHQDTGEPVQVQAEAHARGSDGGGEGEAARVREQGQARAVHPAARAPEQSRDKLASSSATHRATGRLSRTAVRASGHMPTASDRENARARLFKLQQPGLGAAPTADRSEEDVWGMVRDTGLMLLGMLGVGGLVWFFMWYLKKRREEAGKDDAPSRADYLPLPTWPAAPAAPPAAAVYVDSGALDALRAEVGELHARLGMAEEHGLVLERPPPSLPYKVDTSRPSLRTNWTRLVSQVLERRVEYLAGEVLEVRADAHRALRRSDRGGWSAARTLAARDSPAGARDSPAGVYGFIQSAK